MLFSEYMSLHYSFIDVHDTTLSKGYRQTSIFLFGIQRFFLSIGVSFFGIGKSRFLFREISRDMATATATATISSNRNRNKNRNSNNNNNKSNRNNIIIANDWVNMVNFLSDKCYQVASYFRLIINLRAIQLVWHSWWEASHKPFSGSVISTGNN